LKELAIVCRKANRSSASARPIGDFVIINDPAQKVLCRETPEILYSEAIRIPLMSMQDISCPVHKRQQFIIHHHPSCFLPPSKSRKTSSLLRLHTPWLIRRCLLGSLLGLSKSTGAGDGLVAQINAISTLGGLADDGAECLAGRCAFADGCGLEL
jgi:hypothetical protein